MPSIYGLTEIETELMELFWSRDTSFTFSEILHYCNEVKGHGWAQTTVHTFLTRLIQKGVLESGRKGYKRFYYAAVSREELAHQYASRFVEESYGGSVKNLLVSLNYHSGLSKDELLELRRLLDQELDKPESR
ncbi:MAG TPA: BlaI/MecI/CopY family transcriptional regulator [Candidatus Limivivens intestinipullorum]|uniref:BlaI/MecI/CopY family transcriptional regulator n=1 Tax=Candidatus Limivivens intestinipullorum TaxID=2840858 RepID=A0A9D1EQV6_9FIRM|nr:BlaI/MecI/CopY family transcriptional regulator [Candidatus Limivivens intestinipullorum]